MLASEDKLLLARLPKIMFPSGLGSFQTSLGILSDVQLQAESIIRCMATVITDIPESYGEVSRLYVVAVVSNPSSEHAPGKYSAAMAVCAWSYSARILEAKFLRELATLSAKVHRYHCQHSGKQLCKSGQIVRQILPSLCAKLSIQHLVQSPLQSPLTAAQPLSHVPLQLLLTRLTISQLIELIRLVLLERQIVLRSSSSIVLTACCEAISNILIFPLSWQHHYQPLVWSCSAALRRRRMPALLGLRREVLELGNAAFSTLQRSTVISSMPEEANSEISQRFYSIFDLDSGEAWLGKQFLRWCC